MSGNERELPRSIMEFVPGRQVTLAHLVRNPQKDLCERIGVEKAGALGIMTITPGDGTIIAADIASKAASVKVEFADRFTGCLIISGDIAAVETSLKSALSSLEENLGFSPTNLTRS
jgi:ethanolamine utilization protein EutS